VFMPATLTVHSTRAERAAEVLTKHGGTSLLKPPHTPESLQVSINVISCDSVRKGSVSV
jgi:hypothetical protein